MLPLIVIYDVSGNNFISANVNIMFMMSKTFPTPHMASDYGNRAKNEIFLAWESGLV